MKKALLIIAVVAAAVVAALWFFVRSEAFESRVRPLIAGPLQDVLGPEARFGRIRASLVPLYVEVRDLSIPASGKREAVAVRRVRVYFNPLPLLYRTVSIPSIAVLEPRFAADRAADGAIDLASLAAEIRRNIEKRAQPGAPRYDVIIRTLSVRNGKVVLRDAGTRSVAALSRMDLKVKLNLAGPSFSARLSSADLSLTAPAYREITGRLRGGITFERGSLSLENCELTVEDARLSASGSMGLSEDGRLDLKVASRIGHGALAKLTDLLAGEKRAKRPSVDMAVRVSGTRRNPVMTGSAELSGITFRGVELRDAAARFSYREGAIVLAASDLQISRGTRRSSVQSLSVEALYRSGSMEVRRMDVQADDLALQAAGVISPSEGYRIDVSGASTGEGRMLSLIAGLDIAGSASVQGTLSGPLALPQFGGRLSAGPVTVRKVTFTHAEGEIAYRDRTLFLSAVDIRHGEFRYLFNGSMDLRGPDVLYQARLDVLRSDVVSIVALFYERLPLTLDAKGYLAFQGTSREFTGEAKLDLEAGSAYGESFDRGSLVVELSTDRVSFPRVLLDKKQGTVTGDGWIGFDGTYEAHIESEGVDLSEVDRIKQLSCAGPFELDIRSSGRFSAPVVHAHAESEALSCRQTPLGPAKADLDISGGILDFSSAAGNGSFAMKGTWTLQRPYPWDVSSTIRLSAFDPSSFAGAGALLAKLRVDVDGSVRLKGRGMDKNSMRGEALFRTLGFAFGDLRIANEGDAVIKVDGGRVLLQSLALAGPGTRFAVTGSAAPGTDLDLIFTGDANLSLLRALFREVEHGDGIARMRLSVSDAWSNPDIEGMLAVKDGVVKIRDIPQKFTALNGTVSFSQGKIATEGVSGEFGGGNVTLSGTAELEGVALKEFAARAAVDNVTVRYPAGLTAAVGGALYYDGDASAQMLSGEIAVRKARYEKRIDWKSMLVDFRKGFTRKRQADIGWIGDTQLNVRFTGKENVLFESNLAKIPLSVDMLFRGTVNQPQVLGRVEARKGEVYFRKNVFKILHASADFSDPGRINPNLDVRAETKVREYQIQMGVSGTADRAVVTFVSDPPLSDTNVLALLTIGRRSEELKGMERNVGVGEATAFATGKFQDILESRARSITGLDRFQVDPYISKTDAAVPRVTVGKEVVQDKLFMTYSSNVGAPVPEQVFRIEYMLNKSISLVGEQNELGSIGADVKFRFEFR